MSFDLPGRLARSAGVRLSLWFAVIFIVCVAGRAGHPRIVAGLIPPEGVVRAGAQIAALGRRDIAAAARQRNRDLVEQTNAFIHDPTSALPHYPLWDMNRGFGP